MTTTSMREEAPPGDRMQTIGAVCARLRQEFPDVSISKIRYLEDQGLIAPRRTPGGYRLFSEEDVERLVPAALQTRVYALADAVMRREPEAALTALERLLMAGQPAPVLLAAIAGRLRQLLLLRELLAARVPEPQIRERLGLRSQPQFDILRRQAQALSPTRLETAYLRVLDADRALKGGRMDDVTVLETLVAELAG